MFSWMFILYTEINPILHFKFCCSNEFYFVASFAQGSLGVSLWSGLLGWGKEEKGGEGLQQTRWLARLPRDVPGTITRFPLSCTGLPSSTRSLATACCFCLCSITSLSQQPLSELTPSCKCATSPLSGSSAHTALGELPDAAETLLLPSTMVSSGSPQEEVLISYPSFCGPVNTPSYVLQALFLFPAQTICQHFPEVVLWNS